MAFRAGKQRNSMRKALSCSICTINCHVRFQISTEPRALRGLRCSKKPTPPGVPVLYTQSTNAAAEGDTEIASMDIILNVLLLFLLYPLKPKVLLQDWSCLKAAAPPRTGSTGVLWTSCKSRTPKSIKYFFI